MNEQFIRVEDTIINKNQISYIEKFDSNVSYSMFSAIRIYLNQETDSAKVLQFKFKKKKRDLEFNKIYKQLFKI